MLHIAIERDSFVKFGFQIYYTWTLCKVGSLQKKQTNPKNPKQNSGESIY